MTEQDNFNKWLLSPKSNGYTLRNQHEALFAWEACAEQKQAEIDLLTKQIEELRNVCTEAYVLAGAYDANNLALDNLFAASNGDTIPHKSFLPVVSRKSFAKYQAEIDALRKELEQVKMHNVMFAKAAKFVHEDLIIRAKLEGDDSLNISQSALDAILSAITATSEQVEAYRAEIIAQAEQAGYDRAVNLMKCDRYYTSVDQVIAKVNEC